MHGCVFLCPRNARVALACGSWRATTTRALRNRLLGSRDPLLRRSILRTTLHIYYSPRHSLDRTDPQFPWRGTVEPSLLSRMLTARRTFHRSGSLLSHHPSNLLSVLNRGRMIAWHRIRGMRFAFRPEKAIVSSLWMGIKLNYFRDLYANFFLFFFFWRMQ